MRILHSSANISRTIIQSGATVTVHCYPSNEIWSYDDPKKWPQITFWRRWDRTLKSTITGPSASGEEQTTRCVAGHQQLQHCSLSLRSVRFLMTDVNQPQIWMWGFLRRLFVEKRKCFGLFQLRFFSHISLDSSSAGRWWKVLGSRSG